MAVNKNNYYAATEESCLETGYFGVIHIFRDAEGLDHEVMVCNKCLTWDDAKSLAAKLNAQNKSEDSEV